MKSLTVRHPGMPFETDVHLPHSKSLSNRALVMAALCTSPPRLNNLSESADTRLMKKLLSQVKSDSRVAGDSTLHCANAGTVFRFLTAFLSRAKGIWELTGSERMKKRPIGPLVDALKNLGAQIEYLGTPGFPPLKITGTTLSGSRATVDPSASSQYVSALLLIAPTLPDGLEINFSNPPSSLPYIHMTLELMRHFGVDSTFQKNRIVVKQQDYRARPYAIEPDWSAASFWYEIIALSNQGSVFLPGLQKRSLQGDSILPALFNRLGVKSRFDKSGLIIHQEGKPEAEFHFDFTDHPDLLQPLLSACAGLGIKGLFTGLDSLRIKETDRIAAMENELNKLGIECRTQRISERKIDTTLKLEEPLNRSFFNSSGPVPSIHTYGDHRMAMAFAPLSQRLGPLEIRDPEVVIKSYPGYWNELEKAGFVLERGERPD